MYYLTVCLWSPGKLFQTPTYLSKVKLVPIKISILRGYIVQTPKISQTIYSLFPPLY